VSSPEKNTAYTGVDSVKLGITFLALVYAPENVTDELLAVNGYCDVATVRLGKAMKGSAGDLGSIDTINCEAIE
jgi:hypothetical protein